MFSEEKREIIRNFEQTCSQGIGRISGNLDLLISLLERNATADEIKLLLAAIISDSDMLSHLFLDLYKYSGAEKYWEWHIVFDSINTYVVDLTSDAPRDMIPRLRSDAEIIKSINSLLGEVVPKYYDRLLQVPADYMSKLASLARTITE